MSAVWHGIRSAVQARARMVAVVAILSLALGLALSMAVAKQAVDARVDDVKSTVGSTLVVSAAGTGGGGGFSIRFGGGGGTGGDMSQHNLSFLESASYVADTTLTLFVPLEGNETDLQSSLGGGGGDQGGLTIRQGGGSGGEFQPPVFATGTTDPQERSGIIGGQPELLEGEWFDGSGDASVALVGTRLAEANELGVGDTFTALNRTITVVGITEAGDQFSDGGLLFPLRTFQELTGQSGRVSNAFVRVGSIDLVAAAMDDIRGRLGDEADVSQQDQLAQMSIAPLAAIGETAVFGLVVGVLSGGVILYFVMTLIVKERLQVIGVLKALGATNTRVVAQFLSEGVFLTLLAGLFGTLIGVVASGPILSALAQNESSDPIGPGPPRFLQTAEGLEATIGTTTLVLAGILVLVVAVLGCAIPAWRASRVHPAELFRR